MRLIVWGMFLAVVAGGITYLIFMAGRAVEAAKQRKSQLRVMDTPGWRPPPPGPTEKRKN